VAANELVKTWRDIGPVAWAEGPFGWTGEDGKPITLEPWQRAVLSAWWERREDVTTLAVSNVKKTGKTFVNAVLLAWRWLALPGEHFAAGNDLDQSQGRQFQMIVEMVRRNPYLAQNVKVTRSQLIFEPTGSTLTALAVDAAGNAGANHLTVSHTEAWGIIYEEGIRAFEELTPPPGRRYGFLALRIADSYAGFLGESDTWHKMVDRGVQGQRVSEDWPIFQDSGLLLFHMEGQEARERCFRGTEAEAAAYYAEQRRDLRANTFTRMHENRRTANESAFILPEQWAACYSPDVQRWADGDTRRLVLGADASTSRDLTALVGVTRDDEQRLTEAVYCRVWKPQRNRYRSNKLTVDIDETIGDEVLRLHSLGAVLAVVADPFQLHTCILRWGKAGIPVIELPQNAARVEADQALYDAILGRTLAHCGDPTLTEHVQNAVAIETPRGFRLAKEKTSRKIDAAVALSMAHHVAQRRRRWDTRPDEQACETPAAGAARYLSAPSMAPPPRIHVLDEAFRERGIVERLAHEGRISLRGKL
jgi:phage terminase large subunit-like protein